MTQNEDGNKNAPAANSLANADVWRLVANLPVQMTIEAFRFCSQRLAAHADYLSALAHTKGADSAMKLNRDFMETAARDYRHEANALAHVVQHAIETSDRRIAH